MMPSKTRMESGMMNFSNTSAAGVLFATHQQNVRTPTKSTYSQAATRFTGAFRCRKLLFCISAAISAPTPPVTLASCSTSRRPVLRTLASIVCTSQGSTVRKSISSIEAPRRDFGTKCSSEGGGEERRCMAVSAW